MYQKGKISLTMVLLKKLQVPATLSPNLTLSALIAGGVLTLWGIWLKQFYMNDYKEVFCAEPECVNLQLLPSVLMFFFETMK